jgi:hypothetical protein
LVTAYKQAVLAAAFRGDLTREWRQENSGTLIWRDVVLKDIAEIRSGALGKVFGTAGDAGRAALGHKGGQKQSHRHAEQEDELIEHLVKKHKSGYHHPMA